MDNIEFIISSYEKANHPLFNSRSKEFQAVSGYCAAYGHTITDSEFDTALAERFGDGCELEWSRD